MANDTTFEKLNSLILSASDIKELTEWPDSMVEDYLNILRNLVNIATDVDVIDDREMIFDQKASQLLAVVSGEIRHMQGQVNRHLRDAANINQLLYVW